MTDAILDALRPQPTGGLVVTFKQGTERGYQLECLSKYAGSGARSLSVSSESTADVGADVPAILLEDSGIAFVSESEDTSTIRARMDEDAATENVRPEFWLFALLDSFSDTTERTWGIAATGAETSPFTGAGIKLAVLDTGLDLGHPEFAGRAIVSQSFVTGETVQDVQGHGTHCCGTSAGQASLPGMPRYGVAPGAELHVGKVLNNQGSGRERDILTGMLWAISQGCQVISMSLGRAVRPGETFTPDYERVGQMALDSGSLIVAAAGNESSRDIGFIAPVGAPANSPSIMAVAALGQSLNVAEFSCGGLNPDGGEVDLAAPGVGVFSAFPRPELHKLLRGTSMACPHVAGLAALWAESDPTLRGRDLWQKLVAAARSLPEPVRDVGAGLAQAPAKGVTVA